MDYTELIKNIKNKLKHYQKKINVINDSLDLNKKIKEDLENNFDKRVNYILNSTEATKDLINVSNQIEKFIKEYNKDKTNARLSFIIKQLKEKQNEKLAEFNEKKEKVINDLKKKIKNLDNNINMMLNEIDNRTNIYIIPSLNSLEHLKRLNTFNKYIESNNKKKLLDAQFKIKLEFDNIKNKKTSINNNIQKEHLQIQLESISEGLYSIRNNKAQIKADIKKYIPTGLPLIPNDKTKTKTKPSITKTDTPKTKTDTSKTDTPKTKTDTSKTDTSKTKTDSSKTKTDSSKTDSSKSDSSKTKTNTTKSKAILKK